MTVLFAIKIAFNQLYTNQFNKILSTVKNPYGDGCASEKIIQVLKTIDLDNILKKSFFDK